MVPARVRREAQAIVWQNGVGSLGRACMDDRDYAVLTGDSDAARRALLDRQSHLRDIIGGNGELLAQVSPALGPPFPRDCLSGPLRYYLGLEPACNLQCSFCGPRDLHSSQKRPTPQFEAFLIKQIADSGAFQVQLTGGEICLRGWDLLRTIEQISARDMGILISTNGVWDHISNPEQFAQALSEYPIVQLKVSIEGNEELHDNMRGKGTYRKALRTLYLLSDAGLPVRINATIFRSSCNETQLRHLLQLAKDTGAALQAIPVRESGRAANLTEEMPAPAQLASYTRLATELREEYGISMAFNFDVHGGEGQVPVLDPDRPISCAAGLWGLHVTHTGEVYPCGFAIEMIEQGRRRFLAGQISHETSLLRLWRESDVLREWRLAGKCAQCQGCEHYGRGCWGGCCVSAWAATRSLSAMDPYCPLGHAS